MRSWGSSGYLKLTILHPSVKSKNTTTGLATYICSNVVEKLFARVPYDQRLVVGSEVVPAVDGHGHGRVRHDGVECVGQRAQLEAGDERRSEPLLADEADMDVVIRHDDDDLRPEGAGDAGDVHRLPEVDAEVEVEHGEAADAEPVVVPVEERGAHQVLGARRQGPHGVAVTGAGGEAPEVVVGSRQARVDVLGGDVVADARIDELRVRDVR